MAATTAVSPYVTLFLENLTYRLSTQEATNQLKYNPNMHVIAR